MNAILERISNAGHRAWLTFTQWVNAIAVSAIGGALVVHQAYPDLIRQILSAAPKPVAIGGLFLFGVAVHLALRQAKKAGQ